jgi:cytochrome c-type biogenesis protein CcmH/NrfG
MAKKQTQKREKEKIESKYIRLEMALIIALVTFVLGFFTGEIIELTKSERSTMGVQQAQMGQKQPQMPAQKPRLTPEQKRSKILELEKRVASNPGDVKAWNELGHLHLDGRQPKEGIRAFKKVVELNPNNAHAWTDLGIMYRQNKQPVEAIGAFDKAIEIEPRRSEESRYMKGVVLMRDLNDPEGGIKAWEEFLKVNPSATLPNGQPLRDAIKELKKSYNEKKNS